MVISHDIKLIPLEKTTAYLFPAAASIAKEQEQENGRIKNTRKHG